MTPTDPAVQTLIARLVAQLGCADVQPVGARAGALAATVLPPDSGEGTIVVVDHDVVPDALPADPAAVVVLGSGNHSDGGEIDEPRWTRAGFDVAWRGQVGRGPTAQLVLVPEGDDRVAPLLAAGAQGLLLDARARPADARERPLSGMRIAVVTYEFVGVTHNGGIGTANTSLAHALADAGADVDVLATGFHGYVDASGEKLAGLDHSGLTVHKLDDDGSPEVRAPYWDVRRAHAAYRWVREQHQRWPFDVIHVPESRGHGAYLIAAKRAGLAFTDTTIVVETHSPMLWQHEGNLLPFDSMEALVADHLERVSIEGADALVSPSAYMFNYLDERGYHTRAPRFVQQYVVPTDFADRLRGLPDEASGADEADDPTGPDGGPTEVVFFGRLETRKGLDVFLDALDVLAQEEPERRLRVTFMGRPGIEGEPPEQQIERRSKAWPWEVAVHTRFDQPHAMAYLRRRDCIPVMPSRVDNLPLTVMEAVALGGPFLASDAGGTAEIVDLRDRDRCIVPWREPGKLAPVGFDELDSPRPVRALADGIRRALDRPREPIRFAVDPDEGRDAHVQWHVGLRRSAAEDEAPAVAATPSIAVVGLGAAGPDAPCAGEAVGDGVLAEVVARQAASHVLLVAPEHAIVPHGLEILEKAVARTGAPVISFAVLADGGKGWVVPPGGPALAGCVHDVFSAGSVLVDRSVIQPGDIPPDAPADVALQALLARLALRGVLPLVLPEPVALQRRATGRRDVEQAPSIVDASTLSPDMRRARFVLRVYREQLSPALREMPALLRASVDRAGKATAAQRRAEERVMEFDRHLKDAWARVKELDDLRKDAERVLLERDRELEVWRRDAAARVAAGESEGADTRALVELRDRRAVRLALRAARALSAVRARAGRARR